MQFATSEPPRRSAVLLDLTQGLPQRLARQAKRTDQPEVAPPELHADPEQCARQFAPLVRQIARYVTRAMPRSVDINDLIQLGMMGLMEAARRYRRTAGASFKTYAAQRVRGAMLDGLRKTDPTPRRTRTRMRLVENATTRLEHVLQRRPGTAEVAAELGWPLDDYLAVQQQTHAQQIIRWEDLAEHTKQEPRGAQDGDPLDRLIERETAACLRSEMQRLPERERKVLELYYWKEFKLREIGAMLGLSEARVCQVMGEAVRKLRHKLQFAPSAAA